MTEPLPDPLDELDWAELDEEQLEEVIHFTWLLMGRGPSQYINQRRPFTSRSTGRRPPSRSPAT